MILFSFELSPEAIPKYLFCLSLFERLLRSTMRSISATFFAKNVGRNVPKYNKQRYYVTVYNKIRNSDQILVT